MSIVDDELSGASGLVKRRNACRRARDVAYQGCAFEISAYIELEWIGRTRRSGRKRFVDVAFAALCDGVAAAAWIAQEQSELDFVGGPTGIDLKNVRGEVAGLGQDQVLGIYRDSEFVLMRDTLELRESAAG